MTETDLSTWLPIAETAAQIGCSTRTVERLAAAKTLEQRLRPQAGSPAVAVYNPDDVAAEARKRHPAPAPFVLGAVTDPALGNGNGRALSVGPSKENLLARIPPADDLIRGLALLISKALQSPPSPPVAETVAERPVLTLDEAVAASGWSRTYLLRKIHAGTLKAEKDRGWKIRRRDLEQL